MAKDVQIRYLHSRTGTPFVAAVDYDSEDKSLTIATSAAYGWRSAHRDFAQDSLKGRILREAERKFKAKTGELCVVTTWETK
ncbi:hypothetical protein ACWF99_23710 [Nocardia sp. NPDC055002]